MKREYIDQAMQEISDTYLAEAALPMPRKRFFPLGAIVAALALVLLAGLVLRHTFPRAPQITSPTLVPVSLDAISLSQGTRAASWDSDFELWTSQRHQRKRVLSEAKASLSDFYIQTSQSVLSDAPGNRVYSPANLYIALAMTAELSEGSTQSQILHALGVSDLAALRTQVGAIWESLYTEGDYEKLVLANSLWLDDTIEYDRAVMEDLSYHHYASVYRHDLQSESIGRAIHSWLNENTGNLLQDAVENVQMEPDTLFALYSTIYFQSKWSTEFLPDSNTQGLFYGDFPSMVTYMNENLAQMYYFWDPDFSAVYRTLRNGSTMWFILPDPGKTAEDILMSGRFLELAIAGFGPEAWPNQKYVRVNLSIPKFDISGRINLRSELQSLGITHAFDPKQASFPSVGGGFLTDVSQAARVAIDENGVVAAAYTEFLCGSAMPPEEILDFRLDRPFLFVIVKEQIPLFVGIVASPQ